MSVRSTPLAAVVNVATPGPVIEKVAVCPLPSLMLCPEMQFALRQDSELVVSRPVLALGSIQKRGVRQLRGRREPRHGGHARNDFIEPDCDAQRDEIESRELSFPALEVELQGGR